MSVTYLRRLNLFDATMVVMGGIIGSGIFMNTPIVARHLPTSFGVLLAWALGGGIALLGALCYAELGAMFPQAGGPYIFLQRAYGRGIAFLYGWSLLLVIATGALAAVAITFARYLAVLVPLGDTGVVVVAVGTILLLTLVNHYGIRPGSLVQDVFTMLKIGGLLGLIVVGSVLFKGGGAGTMAVKLPEFSPLQWVHALAAALIPVLFAYGGWQQVTFIAGEIRRPARNIPLAILLGVSGVVVLYVWTNWVYVSTLTMEALVHSRAPASDVALRVLGDTGARWMALAIAVSSFGITNLIIMVTPRIYQAMARDGLFFHRARRLHPRFRTPTFSLWFQALWAVLLTLSNTYEQLLNYTVFADWVFFGLTAATVWVFRRRLPGLPRPFRTPAVPWIPLLFSGIAAAVVVNDFVVDLKRSLMGLVLLLSGYPVFLWWRRRHSGIGGLRTNRP